MQFWPAVRHNNNNNCRNPIMMVDCTSAAKRGRRRRASVGRASVFPSDHLRTSVGQRQVERQNWLSEAAAGVARQRTPGLRVLGTAPLTLNRASRRKSDLFITCTCSDHIKSQVIFHIYLFPYGNMFGCGIFATTMYLIWARNRIIITRFRSDKMKYCYCHYYYYHIIIIMVSFSFWKIFSFPIFLLP